MIGAKGDLGAQAGQGARPQASAACRRGRVGPGNVPSVPERTDQNRAWGSPALGPENNSSHPPVAAPPMFSVSPTIPSTGLEKCMRLSSCTMQNVGHWGRFPGGSDISRTPAACVQSVRACVLGWTQRSWPGQTHAYCLRRRVPKLVTGWQAGYARACSAQRFPALSASRKSELWR